MEGMYSNSDVERIFSDVLHQILVAADTSSLQSLRGELLQLVRYKMDTQRKVIYSSLLTSQVIDTDLRVCNATTVNT